MISMVILIFEPFHPWIDHAFIYIFWLKTKDIVVASIKATVSGRWIEVQREIRSPALSTPNVSHRVCWKRQLGIYLQDEASIPTKKKSQPQVQQNMRILAMKNIDCGIVLWKKSGRSLEQDDETFVYIQRGSTCGGNTSSCKTFFLTNLRGAV